MICLLGYEIDNATMNWLIVGIGGAITSAVAALWAGGRQIGAFLKPYVISFFDSHKTLVDTMAEQVPVVSATLTKLGETQERQCETLEQHGKILELHGTKLDKLLSGGHEVPK